MIFRVWAVVIIACLGLLVVPTAVGLEYSSTSFKVRDPDINIGGQNGTSTNFGLKGTSGQPVIGQSSSTSFIVRSGFQYYDESQTGIVVFSGYGAPAALVTILDGGSVVSSVSIAGDGSWLKSVNLAAGFHSFSLYEQDSLGLRSSTIGFIANITTGATQTFSNVFFNPTISLTAGSIKQGDSLGIVGSAEPTVTVKSTTNSDPIIVSTTSAGNGSYTITLTGAQTAGLAVGAHSTSDISTNGTLTSDSSQVLGFSVTSVCSGADFNKDGKVDLVDFSILLFNWGQSPPANICTDLNKDGTVNLTDFSIMLFSWTG